MTPDQAKAARALLGRGFQRLAALSGTSVQMVTVFEHTGRVVSMSSRNRTVSANAVAAVRAALEAGGIEFTSGDVPGVRMRQGMQHDY